jgi:hypothetical protein
MVTCECGAHGPIGANKQDAIDKWNALAARPDPDKLAEKIVSVVKHYAYQASNHPEDPPEIHLDPEGVATIERLIAAIIDEQTAVIEKNKEIEQGLINTIEDQKVGIDKLNNRIIGMNTSELLSDHKCTCAEGVVEATIDKVIERGTAKHLCTICDTESSADKLTDRPHRLDFRCGDCSQGMCVAGIWISLADLEAMKADD